VNSVIRQLENWVARPKLSDCTVRDPDSEPYEEDVPGDHADEEEEESTP